MADWTCEPVYFIFDGKASLWHQNSAHVFWPSLEVLFWLSWNHTSTWPWLKIWSVSWSMFQVSDSIWFESLCGFKVFHLFAHTGGRGGGGIESCLIIEINYYGKMTKNPSMSRISMNINVLLPSRPIVNWTLRNKLRWNFNQTTKLFIHENASENIVCEKAAILSRGKWVNESRRSTVRQIHLIKRQNGKIKN